MQISREVVVLVAKSWARGGEVAANDEIITRSQVHSQCVVCSVQCVQCVQCVQYAVQGVQCMFSVCSILIVCSVQCVVCGVWCYQAAFI